MASLQMDRASSSREVFIETAEARRSYESMIFMSAVLVTDSSIAL